MVCSLFLSLPWGIATPKPMPVDLLFALVVPEQATDDHLKILALLAGMFQDAAMRNKLRECHNPETMLKLIREWQPGH